MMQSRDKNNCPHPKGHFNCKIIGCETGEVGGVGNIILQYDYFNICNNMWDLPTDSNILESVSS